MTDLWPRLAPLLARAERPSRYIDHEWGATYKPDVAYRFCMIYPDTYEIGQANQAVRILTNAVNAREGMAAERAYLPAPEFCDVMRKEKLPLFSLESCAPVSEFDAVGITISHELAATNILETLDMSGITIHADKRGETEPLVVGGGPCTYNPEPFHAFFDVITLGEGEESLPEVLSLHRKLKAEGCGRREILRAIAQIPGQYVPSLYEWLSPDEAQKSSSWIRPRDKDVPTTFERCVYEGFATSSAWEPCIVPFSEVVHDRLNVEILRGCTRGCRFCQAGMIYRPVRERSVDNIVDAVKRGLEETGYDEVSLTSLSSTDHSQVSQILSRLNKMYSGKGIRISIPSQRLDSFGVSMAELVAGQKKGGLTFAPEAGTQRLRDVINKNVSEDNLFEAIDAAFAAGWRRCKLYFMIGLPTETDDDIKGIARLAQQAFDRAKAAVAPEQRGNVQMGISCALFVPKPQTPFQWEEQISAEEAQRRVNLLRSSVKYRAIKVGWHDPSTSLIEAVLSRGGRECANLLEEAWRRGARFDAWTECFSYSAWNEAAMHCGLDIEALASRGFSVDEVLPWAHIDCGVDLDFLKLERQRAFEASLTPDCSFEGCVNCGLCPNYDIDLELQEVRHV
ncbi:MAG: TIGR03960 family B12-binding radical SAM protein [Raoultibacter sp.]|jgi:radical SAM family uncharacterized protein